jgi:hypothetical protein
MSVSAKLLYDERRLDDHGPNTPGKRRLAAVRYYEKAGATIKVDQSGVEPKLPDERRLIVVEQADPRPVLSSPAGPLERDHLDLIDVLGNSYVVDQLLPTEPVADGDTWNSDAPVMGALLALDSVAACEVQSVLEESNDQFAKVRLAGIVHGTVDGAATEHDVRGVYLFDRKIGRITRLNLAVHEKRSIGAATPGLDGVAKLRMQVEPLASSPNLTDQVVASLSRAGQSPPKDLLYHAAKLGFRIEHDRQWFVTSQGRESITLRRVDPAGLVAQCTFTTQPPKSAGRQTSLEQFQKDIAFSLGKNFGQLVSSRQWKSQPGHHCYEVVLRGTVEEVPVEWHYYLIAQENGHRVSAAVTIEGPMVERLAGADRTLVESLQLLPRTHSPAQTAARPTDQTGK